MNETGQKQKTKAGSESKTEGRSRTQDKDEIFASRPDCMSGYLTSGGYLNIALAPMSDHWKKMKKVLATEIVSVARHKLLQSKRKEEATNLLRYLLVF
ncbi:cytochrome P450 [Artemisia annua]|uniref:Cytochrome P450 n=1 Tax=Artemisia annua TaxID=35608 RepID=A0A2U1QAL6_ARTAN|nr:cytochrome P450 [Artemisia annua]